MEKEKLKVGDSVYRTFGFSHNIYELATVERITPTQAILSNGTKLKNDPRNNYFGTGAHFDTIGDRYKSYQRTTPEILNEINRKKMIHWVDTQKFTGEEKVNIYNLLKAKPCTQTTDVNQSE